MAIGMASMGMMALGSLMGGGKSPNVTQTNEQSQTLSFNPNISIGGGISAENPNKFSSSFATDIDESGRGGSVPTLSLGTRSTPIIDSTPIVDEVGNVSGFDIGSILNNKMLLLAGGGLVLVTMLSKKKSK